MLFVVTNCEIYKYKSACIIRDWRLYFPSYSMELNPAETLLNTLKGKLVRHNAKVWIAT